jgi:hypothetical protein
LLLIINLIKIWLQYLLRLILQSTSDFNLEGNALQEDKEEERTFFNIQADVSNRMVEFEQGLNKFIVVVRFSFFSIFLLAIVFNLPG